MLYMPAGNNLDLSIQLVQEQYELLWLLLPLRVKMFTCILFTRRIAAEFLVSTEQ